MKVYDDLIEDKFWSTPNLHVALLTLIKTKFHILKNITHIICVAYIIGQYYHIIFYYMC